MLLEKPISCFTFGVKASKRSRVIPDRSGAKITIAAQALSGLPLIKPSKASLSIARKMTLQPCAKSVPATKLSISGFAIAVITVGSSKSDT